MGTVQGIIRPVASLDRKRNPNLGRLIDLWNDGHRETLADLDDGPLADIAEDLVVVEEGDNGHFNYLHYGRRVLEASGTDMGGKSTHDFDTPIGHFFADCYTRTLALNTPLYSVNKARLTHVTHSWERLLLPVSEQQGDSPRRVVCFLKPVVSVSDILADFTRDIGFLGGTLEPVVETDMVVDYAILSLSNVTDLFGFKTMRTLSHLYGRPLTLSEIDKIQTAHDGVTVINRELPSSMDRFGRSLMLKVNGGDRQPIFSLTDATEMLEARKAAEERKRAMEDFASTASDWLWQTDANHVFTMMSPSITDMTGVSPDYYLGKTRVDIVFSQSRDNDVERHLEDLNAHRPFRNFVYAIEHPRAEKTLWIRVNGNPIFGPDGTFEGYRGSGSNITDEVEARESAARRAEELAEAQRIGQLGGWSYDAQSDILTFSPELSDMLGLNGSWKELSQTSGLDMLTAESRARAEASHKRVFDGAPSDQVDVQLETPDGRLLDLNMATRPVIGSLGDVIGLTGTVQNITARKTAERELAQLAFFDPLTGLGNRSYFSQELEKVFTACKVRDQSAGLLLLDLDHFKEVNDSLGHAAGDELLRRVGERLVHSAGAESIVCRLGGDEFAIILPNITSAGEMAILAGTISASFATNIQLGHSAIHAATSIGMVMIPNQTSDPEEAMRFADLALYEAKASGRNRALMFHAGLDNVVQERVNLASDLRHAIAKDELEPHFQVQVDVLSGKVAGFEALMRWKHPTRGYIPPSTFVPIAESSRLIADLGDWMINAVCSQGQSWLDAGGAPLETSINVSVAQLWHRDVESDIKRALNSTGFPADLLCVELTESVFDDEVMPRIQRLFGNLKRLGVKIALDDFGTGYSSLRYLNDLSLDRLKIDRSFVQNCHESAEKRRLLQGILALSKGMGLRTVVEGVENDQELQVVCDLGCDVVQGFYFSKPKPFHEACLDAAQIEAEYGFEPVVWKGPQLADGHSSHAHGVETGWLAKLRAKRVAS